MEKKHNVASSPSIKKNAFFSITYQLVQIIVPIILIPILSGRLQTSGNGSYAFIHSIVLYFSYFALLGVNFYGTKIIAAKKNEGEKVARRYFWIIFSAKAITSLIAIAGYLTFCFIYWQNQFVLFTQLLFLVGNLFDVSWFFMGDENFKSLCLRNIFIKSITFVLIVIFVKTQNDIGIYSLILGMGEVLNQAFMWMLLLKKKIFAKSEETNKILFSEIFTALKGMLVFFIPQLLIELYTILNTTFLGITWGGGTAGYGEVGIFDYANKIVSVLTTIAVALGMVFLARVSSLNQQNKKEEIKRKIELSMFYSLYISLPLVIGVICTGHSFIKWFLNGDDWSKVGLLLYFFPLKVFFVAISNTIGVQYLIPTGKLKQYILSVGIGATVCIILNLILVKALGSIGSVISVLAAEFSVALFQCIIVRKHISVLSVLKRLWRSYVACAAMATFVVLMYLFAYNHICMFFNSFISSGKGILVFADLTIIVCAALIFFFTLILLKDELMMKVLSFLKINTKMKKILLETSIGAVIFCTVLTTSFYSPYNITFQKDFAIRKRSIAVDIALNTRITNKLEDFKKYNLPMATITEEYSLELLDSFNKRENNGFIISFSADQKQVEMITYNFRWSYCLEKGYTFDIGIKYAISKSDFILSHLDTLNICIDMENVGDTSTSKRVFINNSNLELTNYYNNPKRDFIAHDDSTLIWSKSDFGYLDTTKKDHGYCTVSFYFVSPVTKQIASNLSKVDVKQELWFLSN